VARYVETWEVDTEMPHGGLAAVRPQSVRQANLAAVLDQVRRRGPLSRSDIVAATGLTRSAIGGLVGELVDLGLAIEEAALSDGSPGRPSPVVRADGSHFCVLAVEVGVDALAVALVALDGSVVRMRRVPRSRDRMPPSAVIADVIESVGLLECRGPVIDGRRLTAVGAAVPGLIRSGGQVVAVAPNLEWRDVELAAMLREAVQMDVPVLVGNDADLGALGEATFGVRADHMVYVSGEVGVGGSVISDGVRLAGRTGLAGEFGHMLVNPAGHRCSCGAIGCWETEIGERALLRRAGLDADGGVPAVDELFARAAAGESTALDALDAEGRWLGMGIAGLINAFDPEVVVLGALLERVLPYVRDSLDAALAEREIHGLERSVDVVGATFGDDATLLGAAELAFGPLLADPAGVASA